MSTSISSKSLAVVAIASAIPVVILFHAFWLPEPGSFSGLFFLLYPTLVLIPNIFVGLVIGWVFGNSDVSGLRTLILAGVAQGLAVTIATSFGSQGESIVRQLIFMPFEALFVLPALPIILIELGIFYTVGYWLGKRYRTRSAPRNTSA